MNTFYGVNSSSSSSNEQQKNSSLGIFTKSRANLATQGFQRIHDFLLQDQSAKLLPRERVINCLKKRIDKNQKRHVKYNESRKKAHWGNVQRCGSLWTCPVCAKQITEKRRDELKTGLDVWRKQFGGGVLLLSLTFSHSISQPLSFTQPRLKKAYTHFIKTRRVRDLLAAIGVEYKIKGQEVTWGQNGWHPHNHVLLLTKTTVSGFSFFADELSKLWIHSCKQAGLNAPSMTHGLDIQDGTFAEQYISKWGLESELTKGHMKKGKDGSYTPFDLLQLSIEDKPLYADKLPSKLYQEFGISMKGERQLVWGRGLKALLGIEEKTDEELAEETEQNAITLTTVEDYIFGLLCTYQKRHEFLTCLEKDYEDGTFGSGSAEELLLEIVTQENIRLGLAV